MTENNRIPMRLPLIGQKTQLHIQQIEAPNVHPVHLIRENQDGIHITIIGGLTKQELAKMIASFASGLIEHKSSSSEDTTDK